MATLLRSGAEPDAGSQRSQQVLEQYRSSQLVWHLEAAIDDASALSHDEVAKVIIVPKMMHNGPRPVKILLRSVLFLVRAFRHEEMLPPWLSAETIREKIAFQDSLQFQSGPRGAKPRVRDLHRKFRSRRILTFRA